MADPSTPLSMRLITRREGLLALALAAGGATLVACSSESTPAPPTTPPASQTPESEALASEKELVAKYDVAIAGLPTLSQQLTALRDQHVQHVVALGGTPSSTSASTAVVPGFPGPSAGQSAILQALIDAEGIAAAQRVDACLNASDATMARTLTFIAASEGSHLPALKDLQS